MITWMKHWPTCQGTPPQDSYNARLAANRWRNASSPGALAARSGRLAAHSGMVPQLARVPGAAAVAWHRERGVGGFWNRSHRRRVQQQEIST